MRCVNCQGELGSISFQTVGGARLKAKRCLSCGGFWFINGQLQEVSLSAAHQVDNHSPSYALQEHNFICENDRTLMNRVSVAGNPVDSHFWRCSECAAVFVPRGQLAALTDIYHSKRLENQPTAHVGRAQLTEAVLLVGLGVFLATKGWQRNAGLLASGDTLPSQGPVLLPLVLLSVTYLSGVILAILGRKLPLILMGWGVIAVCILGFIVLATGP